MVEKYVWKKNIWTWKSGKGWFKRKASIYLLIIILTIISTIMTTITWNSRNFGRLTETLNMRRKVQQIEKLGLIWNMMCSFLVYSFSISTFYLTIIQHNYYSNLNLRKIEKIRLMLSLICEVLAQVKCKLWKPKAIFVYVG